MASPSLSPAPSFLVSPFHTGLPEIDLLWHIEQEAAQIDSLPAVLEYLTRRAVQLLGGEAGMIGLQEPDGRIALTFFRQPPLSLQENNLPAIEIRHTCLPANHQGFLSWVFQHETSLRSNQAAKDPRTSGHGAYWLGMPLHHVVMVPLHPRVWHPETLASTTRTLGVLAVLNKVTPANHQGFSDTDEELLDLVAGHAGRAILHAQERTDRLRQHHLATLGTLVSGLLHDLRSPLTSMVGFANLMASCDSAPQRAQYALQVQQQSQRLQTMIQEVLAFAKGDQQVLIRRIPLPSFFESLQLALAQELGPITLVLEASYKGFAWVDEAKLLRLIHNLARNTRQAMPQSGWFRIHIDKRPEGLVWTFSDNGPGIPPEVQAHLFEPFVSAKKGGTGLGLAMVKKMVDDHGGTIQVTSSSQGTTFVVTLPQPSERISTTKEIHETL